MSVFRHGGGASRRCAALAGIALAVVGFDRSALGQGADLCANAEPLSLTVPGSAQVSWSTLGANDDRTASCISGNLADVWFSFQPSVSGVISLLTNGAVITVDDGCGGPEVVCAAPGVFATRVDMVPVTAGRSYKIAVEDVGGGDIGFPLFATFSANQLSSNDACANALPAAMGSSAFDNLLATTDGDSSCVADSTRDVWFTFVAPTAGAYRFRVLGGDYSGLFYPVVTLFDQCGGSELGCASIGNQSLNAQTDTLLSAGQSVLIRCASRPSGVYLNAGPSQLVIENAPVAPNDVCANAIPVGTGLTEVSTQDTFFHSPVPCFGGSGGSQPRPDAWYTFTPATTGVISVGLRPIAPNGQQWNGSPPTAVAVYNSCASAPIACGQLTLDYSSKVWTCAVPVTAGVPVLIQVASSAAPGGLARLEILGPGTQPPNFQCENAIQVGTGNHAFDTTLACGSSTLNTPGLWYRFTNTNANRRNVRFQTCDATFDTLLFTQPTCDGSNGWEFANDDGNCSNNPTGSTLRLCLDPQQSVLLCVTSIYGAGTGTLNITSTAPPANDSCGGAVPLNIGNNQVNTTLGCGLRDPNELLCPSIEFDWDRGVWYSFTPTETGVLALTPGRTLGLSVQQGCGGPLIACTNTSYREDLCVPVVAGQSYVIAVTEIASIGVTTDFGTANLNLAFAPGQFSIPPDALQEPEACDVVDPFLECPGDVPILPGAAFTGTAKSFSEFAVQGDLLDRYGFEIFRPGTVRFVGQSQFPGYIEIIDNVDDECNNVYTQDLGSKCFNAFDTGPVNLSRAGAYVFVIHSDDRYWRLCNDVDVSYWVRFEACSSCTPGCPADFNGMNGVTVQDIFDFLTAYFAGDLRADTNASGNLTVQDIFDFLTAYFVGC